MPYPVFKKGDRIIFVDKKEGMVGYPFTYNLTLGKTYLVVADSDRGSTVTIHDDYGREISPFKWRFQPIEGINKEIQDLMTMGYRED